MSETPSTILQLTPLDPAFRADPHSALDAMRSRCPVHRDEVSGTFILTRYADVRGLVSDNSLWRDPMRAESAARLQRQLVDGTPPDQPRGETTSILLLDDPDHDRIRRPLAQAFYARVAKFRGEVERIVEETLEA
ncbi:MAG: hypothetical protein ACREEH_09355, partial [Caulobacteraceae bacterium]